MDRPYTKEQVFEVEMASEAIGVMLHNPWATGTDKWRSLDPENLADLFYDAMVALQNEMLREEY
jgi:hypothetical protein